MLRRFALRFAVLAVASGSVALFGVPAGSAGGST